MQLITYLFTNLNPNPVILTFGLGQSNVNLSCVYMGMWNYFPLGGRIHED